MTNELQYSCLSQIFNFFKIADIRALCMLLNLIKYCSHWKEISCKCIYDRKIFISLFERTFKMMKNGVYFIVIALFVVELLEILFYAK